jgi:flagellar biosynthetic protein FlhB
MSEDRTQDPSTRRVQQARERGQVAHSPELTGAVGLLAAAALLGAWGDDLAAALGALVHDGWSGAVVSADVGEVVARLRQLALAVARPLGAVLAGCATAAVAAHQVQVGGLWVPGLLAPDPARLWAPGRDPGLAARGARGAWSLVRAAVVLAVAALTIRADWAAFQHLGGLEPPALARAAGHALARLAGMLAAATLTLGLVDLGLQHRRLEALLRLTPAEQRADQRALEGDPALRARRRRIARTWRGDASEVLAGAALAVTGPAGLTLVLAGGPPPRRVVIRSMARGAAGLRLRRAAESARLPLVDAPELAEHLARRQAPALPWPAHTLAELAALWPPHSTPTV